LILFLQSNFPSTGSPSLPLRFAFGSAGSIGLFASPHGRASFALCPGTNNWDSTEHFSSPLHSNFPTQTQWLPLTLLSSPAGPPRP
jgi:hypothetical protein